LNAEQQRKANGVSFVRWVLVGVPALSAIALLAAFGFHMGLGIPTKSLAIPLILFLAWQYLFYFLMFWLRKSFKGLRVATAVSGIYCLGAGLMVIKYGQQWGLTSAETADFDTVAFPICVVLATAVAVLVVPRLQSVLPPVN
jgi:hypothetical protein